jgi:hypothetical protein
MTENERPGMATAVAEPGVAGSAARPLGKPRSVLGVILLSLVTLGFYGFYWLYKTYQEMKDHTGVGIGGVVGVILAIFVYLGPLDAFVGFVNPFIMSSEVGRMYDAEGQAKPVSWITGLWILLPLVGGIIWLVKTQNALNRYWESHGATA